jgi:osmotically-inducible protein OsmY
MTAQQDQAVAAAVRRALSGHDALRTSKHQVEIQVEGGVVTLSGFEPSYTLRRLAEEVAASVPGVREVRNDLSCDPELEQYVALALAQDPRTQDASPWIQVKAIAGTVVLTGAVPSGEVAAAAEEVALNTRGTWEVRSFLQARD